MKTKIRTLPISLKLARNLVYLFKNDRRKGDDFQPFIRISGTGNYKVTSTTENHPDLDAVFLYDGRPEDRSKTGIRELHIPLGFKGDFTYLSATVYSYKQVKKLQ